MSSILKIPKFFLDHIAFEKGLQEAGEKQKENLLSMRDHWKCCINKKFMEETFPFLKEFEYDYILLKKNITLEKFFNNKEALKLYKHFSILHDDFKHQAPVQLYSFQNFQTMQPS